MRVRAVCLLVGGEKPPPEWGVLCECLAGAIVKNSR